MTDLREKGKIIQLQKEKEKETQDSEFRITKLKKEIEKENLKD